MEGVATGGVDGRRDCWYHRLTPSASALGEPQGTWSQGWTRRTTLTSAALSPPPPPPPLQSIVMVGDGTTDKEAAEVEGGADLFIGE